MRLTGLRRMGWGLARSLGRPSLALALQGGGSHGAFTWGVLDRLLETRVSILGISGASAGALNAAALACGLVQGGHDGARRTLEALWLGVAEQAHSGPLQSTPLDHLLHGWNRDYSPGFVLLKNLSRLASPYQLNPGDYNPLVQLLEKFIDFDALRHRHAPPLFIALTNVRSGRLVLHRNQDLRPRSLLASACLPLLFQAIEIDGEHYWDGGYTGNPPLFPLLLETPANDLLVVQLAPDRHEAVPTQVSGIVDRANEIAFQSTLTRELQILAGLRRAGRLRGGSGIFLHRISADEDVAGLGGASRINADRAFLEHLRDQGRQRADEWLSSQGGHIGGTPTTRLDDFLV